MLGLSALVLAFTITADNCAHSLYVPASGSGLQACPLRGSRGNSETALAISGAARFTAHGSGAGVLGAALVRGGGAGSAVAGATVVVLGPGVLETVESPEPQPASISAAATAVTARRHFTVAHRTATSVARSGRRRGGSERC